MAEGQSPTACPATVDQARSSTRTVGKNKRDESKTDREQNKKTNKQKKKLDVL